MSKRAREIVSMEESPPAKRARCDQSDRLSVLSDEVLLHILSFLPIPSLITCQRLSRRFQNLAGDSELWKLKYYNRWVWPRARRLRHLKRTGVSPETIGFSPQVSRRLDHGRLVMDAPITSWKNQYRLKHNWSTGLCRVTEVEVAQPPIPAGLVKMEKGIVFTADSTNGLRARSMKDTGVSFAQTTFNEAGEDCGAPTAITITAHSDCHDYFEVIVGFENGAFVLYSLDPSTGQFRWRLTHHESGNGYITALASSSYYLLVHSQRQVLSLYRLFSKLDKSTEAVSLPTPRLMTSLQASNVQAPLSLSVRTIAGDIIASIAYSFTRIGLGWSVGLQEVHLNDKGENVESRVATTVDSQYSRDCWARSADSRKLEGGRATVSTVHGLEVSYTFCATLSSSDRPTSVSYSHPYLLLSHDDNTLTMYLVVSTADSLSIKAGRRLWGHTSSVANVQVSDRGKAVSVSTKGDDIRIWELESVVSSLPSSRRALRQETSIQLTPERPHTGPNPLEVGVYPSNGEKRTNGLGLALDHVSAEATQMRGLVGFDDEQVVVLCERDAGAQMLGCYDFT